MNAETTEEALRNFGATSGLSVLVEEYIWLAIVGFALLFMKESIQNLIAGLVLFIGNDYNANDIVWLQTNGHRRAARISKIGLLNCSFYLYDVETDAKGVQHIVGGTLMKLPNSQLPSLRIERPLDSLPLNEKE